MASVISDFCLFISIVIYIYVKFREIWFRGYLITANYMDFKSIQGL